MDVLLLTLGAVLLIAVGNALFLRDD